jgi:hypothetical protein
MIIQSLITPQAGDDYTEGAISFHPVRQEANARLVNTSYKINLVTFFLLHKASVKIQGSAAQAPVHTSTTCTTLKIAQFMGNKLQRP